MTNVILHDLTSDAEGSRGESALSFEHIAELGIIDESGSGRDLGNMHLGMQQQRFGIIQALQYKITVRGMSKSFLEQMPEAVVAITGHFCQRGHGELMAVMLIHIIQHILHLILCRGMEIRGGEQPLQIHGNFAHLQIQQLGEPVTLALEFCIHPLQGLQYGMFLIIVKNAG